MPLVARNLSDLDGRVEHPCLDEGVGVGVANGALVGVVDGRLGTGNLTALQLDEGDTSGRGAFPARIAQLAPERECLLKVVLDGVEIGAGPRQLSLGTHGQRKREEGLPPLRLTPGDARVGERLGP